MDRRTIVLLGIGHTNAHVVHQWATDPLPNCDLVCVSKFPYSTYSGMLPGTLGHQFERSEMQIDLAPLAERAGAKVIVAETNGLNLDSGELLFRDHEPIRFDALSIGVGSMPAEWQRHQHSRLLVPVKPMQTFLERLQTHLFSYEDESAQPIRCTIVGGGVASVEIALCVQQRWQSENQKRPLRIEIITNSPRVADGMREKSVSRIERILAKRGVVVFAHERIAEVHQDAVVAESGRTFPSDCVIWATGAAAPPVLDVLDIQKDDRGFIATSPTLQSLSDPRIFAVGDCGTIVESPAPKAGVYAVRQCPILWHNVRAFLQGEKLTRYEPQRDFLKLLNTGDGKALLEYGAWTAHARWCWHLKTWIDKRFIREFQHSNGSGSV